jgi:prepilin-type N-terminal cleavage/methylation domain-containing protein
MKNQKGFTLTELLVVMAIMTFIALAIVEVMIKTASAMIMQTSVNIAQSSVEQVISRMAEDIRQAGSNDLEHIKTGSNPTKIIFTRFGQNLDAYVGEKKDMNYDIACYDFIAPSGTDPFNDGYRGGYIEGGSGSGDTSSCANIYPLTDTYSDVRDMVISYYHPSGSNGELTGFDQIDNTSIPDEDYRGTAACVFMVKIWVKYSRKYNKTGNAMNSTYYENSAKEYSTAVAPRNIITMSAGIDNDKDYIQDCCDSNAGGYDADWCKPAHSN